MIDDHIRSFDEHYGALGGEEFAAARFPLADIEAFRWNRGKWNDAYYSYHYRRFTCHILSRLAPAAGQSILVIGCGFGFDEKNIKHLFRDTETWSVDVSLNMLKLAVASGSPSRFALALAERLPFPDGCFDRVLAREVIEHVIDPAAMLREMARVLKPGGIAVVTTENEESLGPTNYWDSGIKARLAALMRLPAGQPLYKDEAPTVDEMKSLVERAGLELVEHFFDGALYKYLNELSPRLKARTVGAAHFFSRLENNRALAPLFCDQVKYVLRKPADGAARPQPVQYACVRCGAQLSFTTLWSCAACGASYPQAGPIPDFAHDAGSAARQAPRPPEAGPQTRAGGRARRLLAALRPAYCLLYLAAASAAALFAPGNRRVGSRILPEGDPYRRFLGIP
jgi:ubiquinone/menaquinone biosynthesis C-methylase UbiE